MKFLAERQQDILAHGKSRQRLSTKQAGASELVVSSCLT